MRTDRTRSLLARVGVLAVSFTLPAVAQEEPTLVAEQATGLIALDGHNRVDLRGFEGALLIRGGKEDELRFGGRELENRRAERPLAVWQEGRSLLIRPSGAETASDIFIELVVGPSLELVVEAHNAKIQSSALQGGMIVEGTGLELDLRGMVSPVELNVSNSKVQVQRSKGDVTVEGAELELNLGPVEGLTTLRIEQSSGKLQQLEGGLDLDMEQSNLDVSVVSGELFAVTDGGTLALAGVSGTAELELGGTPLSLRASSGTVTVETDADVRFEQQAGPLRVVSYGGAIRGSGAEKEVEIETGGGIVELANMNGRTQVKGDNLTVLVRRAQGNLIFETTGSDLRLEQTSGPLQIDNDFGDILIDSASGGVKVTSRDGQVQIKGLNGALELNADGPEVEVTWLSLGDEGNSYIENQSGDVRVNFGNMVSCRIEAEAERSIESDLPKIQVDSDGTSARGAIGRAGKNLIRIKSGGTIYFGMATATQAPS